jgi:hypothetical protein
VLALAAIVVPVTIIAALGYISLRQWETSSDLLFREQARDMASMAAGKVEMMGVRAIPDDADRRHPHPPAPEKIRGGPRSPRAHPHRPRSGVQVHRGMRLSMTDVRRYIKETAC